MKQYIYELNLKRVLSKNKVSRQKVYVSIIFIMMLLLLVYHLKNYVLETGEGLFYQMNQSIEKICQESYLPSLLYSEKEQNTTLNFWIEDQIEMAFPVIGFLDGIQKFEVQDEDHETVQKILESQANEEVMIDENGNLVGEIKTADNVVPVTNGPTLDLSIEKLRDFNYLLSNFYTVDSATMVYESDLNAEELLGKDMRIDTSVDGPKILIFHTHSQEGFVDSVAGDVSTTIVGMGEYLTEQLNKKGIYTIHDTGVYDIIDGKLDRSNAYEYAEASVRKILSENPTVEVVIDLHRDGVAEGTRLVTEIGGKQIAKVMFFNGLSRTRTNGALTYLQNPYIQENLAFSLQMKIACENKYPDFTRKIYLRGYRYSLHMMPKSLLIEAGAQTNTVEEIRNAMDLLAEVLSQVLLGN